MTQFYVAASVVVAVSILYAYANVRKLRFAGSPWVLLAVCAIVAVFWQLATEQGPVVVLGLMFFVGFPLALGISYAVSAMFTRLLGGDSYCSLMDFSVAEILAAKGEFLAAAEECMKQAQKFPEETRCLVRAAEYYEKGGKFLAAISAYHSAMKICKSPQDATLLYARICDLRDKAPESDSIVVQARELALQKTAGTKYSQSVR